MSVSRHSAARTAGSLTGSGLSQAPSADIALVLEGTYPYAIGGVSTWVDDLIRAMPDVTFGVVHLHAGQCPATSPFSRPANVVWQRDLRLPDDLDEIDPRALAARIPPARCVHALATGFAGQVGVALKVRTGTPLLLTEHGVYWYEIQEGAPELECGLRLHGQDLSDGNPCANRTLWVDRFRLIARETYRMADVITTVCEANAALQRQLGAPDPVVIANGVRRPESTLPLTDDELATLHASAREPAGLRIGLVGRVTPIKDIHAFVRAAARVVEEMPETQFYVIGPTDDREYAASVRTLARRLRLADQFHLTGPQPAALWHRHLDIVALTSRSEAQPLALLEAMAHGRPVVAPDVGGCLALVTGEEGEPAGLIVTRPPDDLGLADIAPPMADALLELARNPSQRAHMGRAGQLRTRERTVEAVAQRYRKIYRQLATPAFASSVAA